MHSLSEQEIYKLFKTSECGLNSSEAEKRLEIYGKNELEKPKKPSFIKLFFKQFLNIMVGILLLSAAASIIVAVVNKEYSELFEGFVILFIVIMNAIIGVIQENKAQSCIEELQKYNKINVSVIRGNKEIVDSSLLVPGDIVEIEAGNIVMADIRLIKTNNFYCDESSLTGESVPVEKRADCVFNKSTPIAERKNMAFSGSVVTQGKATGIVVATAQKTQLGKIANLIHKTKKEQTPLQKSIEKIGKVITWVVVAVCAIVFSIELISGNSGIDAIMTSVALAVAAIPESLPAVITIILALGVQQLAKRKCIIKHLHAVETLGSCEIICSDKTGTLTQNKMQVVSHVVSLNNTKAEGEEFKLLCKCAAACNNSIIQNKQVVGEPTEKALYEFALKYVKGNKTVVNEIPFSSKRKMMSVVVDGDVLTCFSKGAPEVILKKCKKTLINGEIVDISNQIQEEIKKQCDIMTDKAYRVIACAFKEITNNQEEIEENLIFVGVLGLMDNPRPEVKESIQKCFSAGLKPIMITGDHKRTAFAVARDLGIATSPEQVITGEELDKLSDAELKKKCNNFSVYARVSPEHKVRIVNAYKGLKKIVAMTGDGVNDAPSLKIADIGVGMGKSGTDVVKSVADMLVSDDNFSTIVVGIEEGRKVYNNIQKALQYLISTNCVEVFGMLISLMFFPKYEFLTAAQMLFINLISDSLPAFALGVEKVENEIMKTPPRNPRSGLFSGVVGVSIIYQAILQTVIAMAVFLVGVYFYSPLEASTMVFFTIIFMQLLHSVNCKTNDSIFEKNLFNNKTFNICFVITLGLNLMVAVCPFMYKIFGLEMLNLSQWIMIVVASLLIVPTCELCKIFINSKKYNKNSSKINKKHKKI